MRACIAIQDAMRTVATGVMVVVEREICGKRVKGYPGRMYCGPACNAKAWRLRHPEQAKEKSRQNWERRKRLSNDSPRQSGARP
jgi:hypothetical protein